MKTKLVLIDGKQRLTTMLDFLDDKFSVILFGKEYLCSELPEDIKYVITMYQLNFNQTYE